VGVALTSGSGVGGGTGVSGIVDIEASSVFVAHPENSKAPAKSRNMTVFIVFARKGISRLRFTINVNYGLSHGLFLLP
jgi:hypothetical protein